MATIDIEVNGVVSKVPVLEANGFIQQSMIPSQKIVPIISNYTDVSSTKAPAVWYTNNSKHDMTVQLLSAWSSITGSTFIEVQSGTTGPVFRIDSVAVNTTHSQPIIVIVPPSWRYRVTLSSTRSIVKWFEITQSPGTPY